MDVMDERVAFGNGEGNARDVSRDVREGGQGAMVLDDWL